MNLLGLPIIFEVARQATIHDYQAWLLEYLNSGGRITHFYSHNWSDDKFYVANRDCFIPNLYATSSICVIVSPFIELEIENELHHNTIYYHAKLDEKTKSSGWVPLYLDINIHPVHLEKIIIRHKETVKQSLEFWKDNNLTNSILEDHKKFERRFKQLGELNV